jgi:transcriptional regulator GlxA family with amidase domain
MGAHEAGYEMTQGEIAFVRECNEKCLALLFVCGSFMVALQTGLLNGKTATAPRPMLPMLRKMSPEVGWVERRWAHDGKIWTSGALLNGTDMTKAFAIETWGGGEDSLVEFALRLGGYPERDVEYKDVSWAV